MTINVTYPGVYIEEVTGGVHPIEGVPTSQAAFVDIFARGPLEEAIRLGSFAEFVQVFGGLDTRSEASYAVQQFFENGGRVAWVVRVAADEPANAEWYNAEAAGAFLGRGERKGIYALSGTGFNILCLPAAAHLSATALKSVYNKAAKFCDDERAFLIVDIPPEIDTPQKAINWLAPSNPDAITRHPNAAVYFPRVMMPDPLNEQHPRNVGVSGAIAGVYARTDAERGVWKAPAGIDMGLRGVALAIRIKDVEYGQLNGLAINSLRDFPAAGVVCWGARTLIGSDVLASDWKYIPVRRMSLFIEESIYRGTKWAVCETNDECLWAQIRLNVGAFMQDLFRRGAFWGARPQDAYFVQCDKTTTTQEDIDGGVVNIVIGFAPVKPAEFVIIRIQQIAGHIAE